MLSSTTTSGRFSVTLYLFGVLMPKGREFRTGDLLLQGVVESQARVLFALVFMLVNSFILFALW